ncbi:nucleotidyl transferase AbiEii/AbiGii toxin family protein [Dietzia sp. E1]|uniref:nucleotidyl transferase AbiEii/AbiGii toxin family protein n=1 Tax=Dietzia sp. E1 TaxID=328361 RepID=UPI0015FBDBCE|nr:nucleotidyl transferase AbiEii/AbiGii toxin family protein [Dietzia sp. E1]
MSDARARSLNHRLRNLAAEHRVDPLHLRNRLLFQLVLRRLAADSRGVLKGGFALETRLWLDARSTKDLDLARLGDGSPDADELHDLLDEALDRDPGDGFRMISRAPRPVRTEDELPTTWRVVIEAYLGSTEFGVVTLDVVTADRLDDDEVEPLLVEPHLLGGPFTVLAVAVDRHAAEKLHAYSRIYAHGRPSSRVKDLVDLVLLLDRGLIDPARLGARLAAVFTDRDGEAPPADLEPPPGSWAEPFAAMATDLGLTYPDHASAFQAVRETYLTALTRPHVNEKDLQ